MLKQLVYTISRLLSTDYGVRVNCYETSFSKHVPHRVNSSVSGVAAVCDEDGTYYGSDE